MEISFNQVFSIDDEEIPTVLGPEAQDKLKMEAAAVGASTVGALALGPIGLVYGALYPDAAGCGDEGHEAGAGRSEIAPGEEGRYSGNV